MKGVRTSFVVSCHLGSAQSTAWPSGLLDQLKTIPASAFVAVDTSPLKIHSYSGAAHQP